VSFDGKVVDLAGKVIDLGVGGPWSPEGDEIWFHDSVEGATRVWAMTPAGRKSLLASLPGDFVLKDVSRDGRSLIERGTEPCLHNI
jgi:Tol biopolymer transport system component